MNRYHTALTICLLYLLPSSPGYSQNNGNADNSDEPKIRARQIRLQYQNKPVPTLAWPQRKHDSPLFCDELIPYKDGYIINSIATSREGRTTAATTSFYYYDLQTQKLSKLVLPGIDTIESLLTTPEDELYYCYKEKGRRQIAFMSKGEKRLLLPAVIDGDMAILDTAAWVKLGYQAGALYALHPNGAFINTDNRWKRLASSSLTNYFLEELKYQGYQSCLPTVNITVANNAIWFLQEILQDRQSRLLKLDLQTGKFSDFFMEQGYTDNYQKEINNYCLLSGNGLVVAASRLMGNYMVLKTGSGPTEVWAFNNMCLNPAGGEEPLAISAILPAGDTMYLAGIDGLYCKYKETVTPLLSWNNTHQDIKDQGEVYNFEFVPRSIARLSKTTFLIGGMWGGIYLVDIGQPSIRCQDDVSEKHIKNLDINKLAGFTR